MSPEAPPFSPAYTRLSSGALRRKLWLFGLMNQGALVQGLGAMASLALRWGLPVDGLVRATIFSQFCGGESLGQSERTIQELAASLIGSIPDYSVEGQNNEEAMDRCLGTLLEGLNFTAQNAHTPLFVFKVSGLVSMPSLVQTAAGQTLSPNEQEHLLRGRQRVDTLLQRAYDLQCPIMVDAEETWIQSPIDQWTTEAMAKYNTQKPLIINTLQMYRWDRLDFLRHEIRQADEGGYIPAFKVVRGAYMEKERSRALSRGYPDPIQPNKESTDRDYDHAIRLLLEHPRAFLCLGTHNRNSCVIATHKMAELGMKPQEPRVLFAQLLGMSDSLSGELAEAGYQVAKYLPYGPVREVLPYLLRRAKENSSAAGEISREYAHLLKERQRRRTPSAANQTSSASG
ncbi:MAG: proline dehydrogenase family protein [Bacteroidota bacterium]